MLLSEYWFVGTLLLMQPLITAPEDVAQLSGEDLASWGEDYIDCAGSFLALSTLTEQDPSTADTHRAALQQADNMTMVASYLLRSFAGDGGALEFAQVVADDIAAAAQSDLTTLAHAEAASPEILQNESATFQMKGIRPLNAA